MSNLCEILFPRWPLWRSKKRYGVKKCLDWIELSMNVTQTLYCSPWCTRSLGRRKPRATGTKLSACMFLELLLQMALAWTTKYKSEQDARCEDNSSENWWSFLRVLPVVETFERWSKLAFVIYQWILDERASGCQIFDLEKMPSLFYRHWERT